MNLRESKRPPEWPKAGLYWFLHHNTPIEWTDDIDERWDYVCTCKPEAELPVRLEWMRPVKGALPKALGDAWKTYDDARKTYDDAWKTYDDARKAYDDAWKTYKPEIDALMAKELSGCPWNGRSLT